MRNRSLRLKKETLAELSTAQLDSVAAASGLTCAVCLPQSDLVQCITGRNCAQTVVCLTGTIQPTTLC